MRYRKRVLFLERNLRNEKLGIMYLAGALKQRGHDADLIQTDKENLDTRIRAYRPDFIAFSITTGEHVYALQMARDIKARYGTPNIFGGPHCTFFPEIAFDSNVDFVVQGQGERAIIDIVEGRVPAGFHKAEMAVHLDDLPRPDRDIFYQYKEFRDNPMKNVITSRACPYKCSYCFNHSQLALSRIDDETKRWFDRRDVSNVTAEINELRDTYGLEKVLFLDDSFIQSRSWLDAFLTGYTNDVRLPWLCSLRVNCLDERLARRMFESRLEMVNYAIESADPDVQQRLLHRGHISNGDVIHAIALFDEYGVRARMQNMIGLPLSNPLEDAFNTLQFNMRHRVTDAWCSIFQAYPRTALGQYCLDHHYISADQLRHCSESFFDESRLNIDNRRELYALQKLWYFAIDANLPLDLVQILVRGRFTAETGDLLQQLRFRCSRKKLYGIDDANAALSVNLQSRERWKSLATGNVTDPTDAASLVRAALAPTGVPDRFVDILAGVAFDESTTNKLRSYLVGEPTYPQPIYTINDDTGELIDPAESIYIRGTKDPDARDIRLMLEAHFMRGMAEVRTDLQTITGSCSTGHHLQDADAPMPQELVTVGVLDNDDNTPRNGTNRDAVGSDERHLNQYLA